MKRRWNFCKNFNKDNNLPSAPDWYMYAEIVNLPTRMKEVTLSLFVDSTPAVISYNRFESDHAWQKKVVITELEIDILGYSEMHVSDLDNLVLDVVEKNEQPYQTIYEI